MKVITIASIEDMKKIEHDWNTFIDKHGKSPFLLSGFINQLLGPNQDLVPHYLVFFSGKEIVGAAPVGFKDIGIRRFRFQPGKDFQPEIFFEPKHGEQVLRQTVRILFREMKAQTVDFSLPAKSFNINTLRRICKEEGVSFSVKPDSGRAIIRITDSWDQFEKDRRHLRREFERTGRRLKELGTVRIRLLRKEESEVEIFEKILRVEHSSWKMRYFQKRGLRVDPILRFIFDGCVQTSREREFNWEVAFLEVNEKPIAYSLFLEHKGHAFICKTSFNDSYKRYGPGIYVNHAVVRELMSRPSVRIIDFMTNLPFSHKWVSEVVPVSSVRISRKSIVLLLFTSLSDSRVVRKAAGFLSRYISFVRMI